MCLRERSIWLLEELHMNWYGYRSVSYALYEQGVGTSGPNQHNLNTLLISIKLFRTTNLTPTKWNRRKQRRYNNISNLDGFHGMALRGHLHGAGVVGSFHVQCLSTLQWPHKKRQQKYYIKSYGFFPVQNQLATDRQTEKMGFLCRYQSNHLWRGPVLIGNATI